jgi:hypothetical protein
MGVLSREEGLKRLNEPSDEKIVEEVKRKLGILNAARRKALGERGNSFNY